MPTTRVLRWCRTSGPLSAALLLHAAFLGAAALATFAVLPQHDEEFGTIALALAKHRPDERRRAPEAPRFAELETRVVESVDDDFDEAELVEARVWTAPAGEEVAPARAPLPQVALDLAPPDFSSLAFSAFGGGTSASGDAGAASGGLGAVAAAGGGSRAAGAPGGGGEGQTGFGTGSGQAALTGEAAAPRARVRGATPIDKPTPIYPKLSRRTGEEGSVLCRLHLSATGAVLEVEVVESSGFVRLDEAAREMLGRWRFEPELVDGRAVATTWLHKVTFQLE
ncbi:MAG: energy transducer TonB [Planctomycetes bacterium]|nr:energy transducer TonB [Planctomycetota bacterium]